MTASPTSRLLTLLSLLQTRRDWPGDVLSGRLDVSARTVRRDVDRLRDMGYRVLALKGPHGGYRLEAGSELPPLLFDDEQAVALAIVLRTAASLGPELEEAALRALGTVRQVMPPRLRSRVDALQISALPAGSPAPVDGDVLISLADAIRASESVRFDYGTPSDADAAGPPRRAEPHALVASAGRWYLVAWDPAREDWRTWRVDRMSLRTHRGAPFSPREIPGGDLRAFVSARFKGSDVVDAWPCVGSAVLALPASAVAPFVGDATVQALGEDRCRLTSGSWSWTALAASLGRFDAEVSDVEPPALARACAAVGDRLARAGAI
jgi:predicted DNA-binding transcriptional regulator YafY